MVDPSPSTRFRGVALAFIAAGVVVLPALVLNGAPFGVPPLVEGAPGGRVDHQLLGASGVLPRDDAVSDDTLAAIQRSEARVQGVPPTGPLRIPPVALDGYRRAEQVLAARQPGCGMRWSLLAGLGQVISGHAEGAGLDRTGTTRNPLLGPVLDGRPGLARIADTDGGRLDLDAEWDRAVGPLQIIPGVWRRVGADSDGDGTANPHNVYDAALAAGRYLCERGADLSSAEGELTAVFRYQRSEDFVRAVLVWSRVYAARAVPDPSVSPGPDELPEFGPPQQVTLPEQPPPAGPPPRGPVRAPVSPLRDEDPSPSPTPDPRTSPSPSPSPSSDPSSEPPPTTTTETTSSPEPSPPTTTGAETMTGSETTTDSGTTSSGTTTSSDPPVSGSGTEAPARES
jgi:hypothetical protein